MNFEANTQAQPNNKNFPPSHTKHTKHDKKKRKPQKLKQTNLSLSISGSSQEFLVKIKNIYS